MHISVTASLIYIQWLSEEEKKTGKAIAAVFFLFISITVQEIPKRKRSMCIITHHYINKINYIDL